MRERILIRSALASFLLMVGVGDASAGLTLVTSRGALGANDHVYWGNLGPAGTHTTNPVTIGSYGGIGVTVAQPDAPQFNVLVQTPVGSPQFDTGWGGNFSVGDIVLASTSLTETGPMTITFAAPISAVGAQIESFAIGPFTAKIEAFDSLGNSLGSFTESGTSAYTADGSAIFLGVSDTTEQIASIQFSLVGATQAFAINELSFASTSSVPGTNPDGTWPSVPEPSSLLMGCVAVVALAAARRRA